MNLKIKLKDKIAQAIITIVWFLNSLGNFKSKNLFACRFKNNLMKKYFKNLMVILVSLLITFCIAWFLLNDYPILFALIVIFIFMGYIIEKTISIQIANKTSIFLKGTQHISGMKKFNEYALDFCIFCFFIPLGIDPVSDILNHKFPEIPKENPIYSYLSLKMLIILVLFNCIIEAIYHVVNGKDSDKEQDKNLPVTMD